MRHLYSILSAVAVALPGMAGAQDATIGKDLFNQYCATCHGADGKGAGPLTEIMLDKPADLTMLAAENQASPGEFPMLRVLHVIDGRTGLRAHGGPMPIYGTIFMEEAGGLDQTGSVLETRGRILSLALYLESIQQ